eukprot:SAG31_NODE_26740_length_437_cov_0.917160_1_plen_123_part_10
MDAVDEHVAEVLAANDDLLELLGRIPAAARPMAPQDSAVYERALSRSVAARLDWLSASPRWGRLAAASGGGLQQHAGCTQLAHHRALRIAGRRSARSCSPGGGMRPKLSGASKLCSPRNRFMP